MGRFVRLPLELHWSYPLREFDLDDDSDRAFVYETVLQQGNENYVREFIDTDELLEIWDEIFLPAHVEAPWADYFERVRGVKVKRRWDSVRYKSA